MICSSTIASAKSEFLTEFGRKILQYRIPINGSIDLTERCNLNCIHCYLGSRKDFNDSCELSASEVCSCIDQIAEAGCLNLLFTGGEPLIRKDFPEIYRYAKLKGMLVDVFTNATHITSDIVQLFRELPPARVEVTFHGSTERTFESVTQVKGSYKKCSDGIRKLLENRISTGIKMIVMNKNLHEFIDVQNLARQMDIPFRYDSAIFPKLDGDNSPVELRISPEQAAELDISDIQRLKKWADHFDKIESSDEDDRHLYMCGAGRQSFHISSTGMLTPCVMMSDPVYDLRHGSFTEGWSRVIPSIRNKHVGNDYQCNNCKNRLLCGYCPAFFKLETGSEYIVSDYLCQTGQRRQRQFDEYLAARRR